MSTARIDRLQPALAERASAGLAALNDLFLPIAFPGFVVHVSDTLRTADEQAKAHAAGLSDVTLGWHNFGLAFDFAVLDNHGVYVTDGAHPVYAFCGATWALLGCRYGIVLRSGQVDHDHVELRPGGMTLAQYIEQHPLVA